MQRSENMQGKYPDIIARVPACLQEDVQTLVIDCEAVAWDKEAKKVLPFQVRWACLGVCSAGAPLGVTGGTRFAAVQAHVESARLGPFSALHCLHSLRQHGGPEGCARH